jgi:hypothetical protein
MTLAWESSRQLPGRRFAPTHELALVDDALRACATLPGSRRGLLVLQEVHGPYGIPDYLACLGDGAALDERLGLDIPPLLNEQDAAIVAAVAVQARRSVATVAKLLGWPLTAVERRLPGLARLGAVYLDDRGLMTRPAGLQPVGRLVAVETKVRDWPQAVRQARRYRLWTENYVLVMPKLSNTVRSRVIAEVERDHGGLMLGGVWVRRPASAQRSAAHRLWGSEHLVAALCGHQPSPRA